jgi:hypothetical protein
MSVARIVPDWKHYEQFKGTDTDKAYAESIGMDPNNFAQHKRRHYRDHPRTSVDTPAEPDTPTTDTASADDTALHSADDSAELASISNTPPPTVQKSAEDSAALARVPDNRDISQTTV